ncbi:MAG: BTAD domain-containing putative transcriptional regulator [Actinomycetota bacterium]|nr:BTAD domain-containing putative transcriptional regulator [Actinomycetota bacterium]
MTELLVLGPVEIRVAGEHVAVLQPRQQQVLAALAVDANRPVTWPTLVDRVWGAQPPEGARTAMRSHVSRIRLALRAAGDRGGRPVRLVRGGGGYEILVDPERIDLHRSRRLVRDARAAGTSDTERVRLLREAVGLWRGEPLAGLTGEWAGRVRSAWQHERLDVVAAWAGAELELGNAPAVIAGVAELADEHPLVESISAVYVRALHAVGRTAESVDRYMRISARLTEELGVSPGAELSAAYRRVLQVAPAAKKPVAGVPSQLPPDVRGFVGRRAALARLDAVVAGSAAMPIVLLRGTAGVGKTTLAVHWAHRVADKFPDGQLYVNLRGFDPVSRPLDPGEAVRRLLAALEVPAARIPSELDAGTALYRSELAGRRMLVVLDNADDESQVRPLLPGVSRCMVVVTSRRQLTGLMVAEAAQSVDVDLISTDEAAQLLGSRLGADRVVNEWQAVTGIIEHCARLPLALAIVAAQAEARPARPLAAIAGELAQARGRLDTLAGDDPHTDLRAVLAHSYYALPAPARRMFRLLGRHPGPDLAVGAAASLTALPPPQARDLLAELVRASLLTEHRQGRYACHDLLRAYAAELDGDDGPDRDEAPLRVLDYYLHSGYAADRALYPGRDPVTLAPPRSGTVPESFPDARQALDWFTAEQTNMVSALQHSAAHGLDTYTWQLAWTMRTFLGRRGHWVEQAAVTGTALAAAERLGDPLLRARTHHQLGTTCTRLGRFDEAERELCRGLELFREAGHQVGQARAHHHLSYLFERRQLFDRSLAHAGQALDLYRRAGHRNGEAHALNGVGWYSAQLGDHSQALARCREALELFQKLDDRPGQASTWDSLGFVLHGLGDHTEAVACYRDAVGLFQSLGDRYNEAGSLTRLGDTYHAAADRAAARRAWEQAVTILTDLRHPDTRRVRDRLEGRS